MAENNPKISLIKVKVKDEKLLFKWSNEKKVRMWSFNNTPIKFLDHKKWFKKNVKNKRIYIWKLKYNSNLCGLVRIKLMKKNFTLSYLITKKFRGKKLGEKMLYLALKKLRKIKPGSKVFAKSLTKNLASNKTLIRAGFKLFKKDFGVKTYISVEPR